MSNIFDLFKKIERTEERLPVSFIIAGLGNPGAKYEDTRHNAGFIGVDYIAEKLGVNINRQKFHALVGEATIEGVRVLLMKPETFMNNSGLAIAEAASFYKLTADRVLILHDEISFDPGVMRIRRKGSSGGHNGLKSIIERMRSEDFPRIKIGVGKKPHPEYDLADWVLGRMPEGDMKLLMSRLPDIYSSAELIVSGRIDDAMSRYSK